MSENIKEDKRKKQDAWIEGILLSEIKDERTNERVVEWDFRQVTPGIRLYLKFNDPADTGLGFTFCAVSWETGTDLNNASPEGNFDPDRNWFTRTYHGWAAFDGIRHLYVGDEGGQGYENYPNIDDHIKTLEIIRQAVKEYLGQI